MSNLFIPNSTQVPDIILDYLMGRLPNAEFKCLLYINRRTFGFNREADHISLSQFEKGIKDREGKQLDYGTGLKKPTIIKALKNLVSSTLVFSHRTRGSNYYKINLKADLDKVIEKVSSNKKDESSFIARRMTSQLKMKF